MTQTFSFEFTNTGYKQIQPFKIEEANEILLGNQYFSHSSFLADIAHVYTRFEFMSLKFIPKIAVCLTTDTLGKYNPTDEESTLESLITFFKLLRVPAQGVQVCFYHIGTNPVKSTVYNARNMQELWGFRNEWVGTGDFIALGKFRKKPYLPDFDTSFVYEYAEDANLKIVEIGYGQTVAQQHDILRECKFLVSPRGSITYFAAMMKTPLVMLTTDESHDSPIAMTNGMIGGVVFQNTIIGTDQDVSTFDNGILKNKPYDRFVFTKPECTKNKELLNKIVTDPASMQEHYKFIIRNNKDLYYPQAEKFKQEIKDIVDDD